MTIFMELVSFEEVYPLVSLMFVLLVISLFAFATQTVNYVCCTGDLLLLHAVTGNALNRRSAVVGPS
jgi:hypothetical protein